MAAPRHRQSVAGRMLLRNSLFVTRQRQSSSTACAASSDSCRSLPAASMQPTTNRFSPFDLALAVRVARRAHVGDEPDDPLLRLDRFASARRRCRSRRRCRRRSRARRGSASTAFASESADQSFAKIRSAVTVPSRASSCSCGTKTSKPAARSCAGALVDEPALGRGEERAGEVDLHAGSSSSSTGSAPRTTSADSRACSSVVRTISFARA